MEMHEEKIRSMEKALRSAGFRLSSQRRAILEYLAGCVSHPSAGQVFKEVKEKHRGLSLATVYNTLGVLTRMSLVKVMEFDGTNNRYDPNVAPHVHLICTVCGKIEDLQHGIPVLPKEIKEKVGFEVLDSRLEYYGVCAECRAGEQGMPGCE